MFEGNDGERKKNSPNNVLLGAVVDAVKLLKNLHWCEASKKLDTYIHLVVCKALALTSRSLS